MEKLLQELSLIFVLLPVLFIMIVLLYLPLLVISSMFALFFFLRNSPTQSKNAPTFFHNFRIGGHRGSPMNAPENTILSFERAAAEGADLIEFDIGLTKDKVPVLMHDDTLDRTTNMIGPLSARLWTELATCNCAAKFNRPQQQQQENGGLAFAVNESAVEPLATLEQVIKWAKARRMKMIFDVKDTNKELIEHIERFFVTYDLFDSTIICSFFPSVIYRIKRRNKDILAGITWRRWAISYVDLEWKMARYNSTILHGLAMLVDVLWMWSIKLWLPQFLGVDMVLTDRGELSANYVNCMREKGFEVCAWTVNDEREMVWMAQNLKIPFLTDVPGVARAVINQTANWK